MEGEAEITVEDALLVPDPEAEVVTDPPATPPPNAVDELLAGKLPDDLAFYRDQALTTEEQFSAEDLASLGTRGKMLVAAMLARQQKAEAQLAEFRAEQDAKVTTARTTLEAAQAERAKALEWTRGENVQEQRARVNTVVADQTPLDPQDPDFVSKAIEREVAARLGEFFAAIDGDAQKREQQVHVNSLNQAYESYRQKYDAFVGEHRDELVVPGQKETVKRWSGEYDAHGRPVEREYVIDKRSPLALRIEEVLRRYGPDESDPRQFRMPFDQAYTLALHELSALNDRAEHDASMARARERVVRPVARQAPQLTPPPIEDSVAFADFLARNPEWAVEQTRKHFGG